MSTKFCESLLGDKLPFPPFHLLPSFFPLPSPLSSFSPYRSISFRLTLYPFVIYGLIHSHSKHNAIASLLASKFEPGAEMLLQKNSSDIRRLWGVAPQALDRGGEAITTIVSMESGTPEKPIYHSTRRRRRCRRARSSAVDPRGKLKSCQGTTCTGEARRMEGDL